MKMFMITNYHKNKSNGHTELGPRVILASLASRLSESGGPEVVTSLPGMQSEFKANDVNLTLSQEKKKSES